MKNITQQIPWNRKLRRALAKMLEEVTQEAQAYAGEAGLEKYRKHFYTQDQTWLLLFHGLMKNESLRQSYTLFSDNPDLVKASGLEGKEGKLKVSFSQFANSNTTRCADFMKHLSFFLIKKVKAIGAVRKHYAKDLRILDSTCLKVSTVLSAWSAGIAHVRLQLEYEPLLSISERCLLTTSRQNDCQGLDEMILEDPQALEQLSGNTICFDLGYYSHRRFELLLQAGIHFVTRRHHQASIQVEEDLPVQASLPGIPQAQITVEKDQRITLGSANNRAGAVLPGLRLVTAQVFPKKPSTDPPVTYQILTDRWDIPAEVVILYYIWRWEIELFFRWLKSNLHLPALLGYSKNAIELTIWLTLVIHLLLMLLANLFSYPLHSPLLLRRLVWCWAQFTCQDFSVSRFSQLPLPFWDDS